MPHKFRIALFTHSVISDWNNGNAHFLRGLARALANLGHEVTCWEERENWSRGELEQHEGTRARSSIAQFHETYPDIRTAFHDGRPQTLEAALLGADVAIVHEWHSPEFMNIVLQMRQYHRCRLLFLDTHHRASSSPEQIRRLRVEEFDGILAFGEAIREIYQHSFGLNKVWTFHEAADTTVFYPAETEKNSDVVWVGNWGDNERTRELHEYLIGPAREVADARWLVHGVRYPQEGLDALRMAGIHYSGYLPNLEAPAVYRSARITLHIPRQQYRTAMQGIPTIRVFEALAMGIPLISAPWQDSEELFRPGDFLRVNSGDEMTVAIRMLLRDSEAAEELALRGLQTVLARHTCRHRAEQLTSICKELLA